MPNDNVCARAIKSDGIYLWYDAYLAKNYNYSMHWEPEDCFIILRIDNIKTRIILECEKNNYGEMYGGLFLTLGDTP